MSKKITVQKIDLAHQSGKRLDLFLIGKFPKLTRSYLQHVIKRGYVFINQKKGKASKKVKEGDRIEISFPIPEKINLEAEQIPLKIIYEDKNILVINKPFGMVVHPGAGNKKGTLLNAVLYHSPDLKRVGNKIRPGIVHRLDKDTSGVVIVAKNDLAFQDLVKQFKNHTVKKEYLGLVYGHVVPKQGKIIASIKRDYHNRKRMAITGVGQGKEAETDYEVKEYFGKQFTLLKLFPKTGRTHQIRVHLNSIGYPIVGDKIYRSKQNFLDRASELGLTRQFLHAAAITIKLLNGKTKKFTVPSPSDLKNALKLLKNV